MANYTYRGIIMRSIAEARWAAFFDVCGIEWQYEPINTGTYIPDFLLFGEEQTIVEVKGGATTLAQVAEETAYVPGELIDHWQGNVVCVGAKPILERDNGALIAGIIYERHYHPRRSEEVGEGDWWGSNAVLGRCEGVHDEGFNTEEPSFDTVTVIRHKNPVFGFASREGWFGLRPSGCYQGGWWGDWDAQDIEDKWASATNMVRHERPR